MTHRSATTQSHAAEVTAIETTATVAKTRKSESYIAAQIIGQLQAISAPLHLRDRLTMTERRTLRAEANLTPTTLIEAVATTATVHGGIVAGLAFDPDQARAAIARSAAVAGVVQWANDFAQSFADDALRDHAAVASRAMRAYGMLSKYVETSDGAAMRGEWERMQEIVKGARKGKRRAAKERTAGDAAASATVDAPTVDGGAAKTGT